MANSFLALFVLFVLALEFSERDKINVPELVFLVYALGFTLEKIAAMQEHGIKGDILSFNMRLRILAHDCTVVYFKGTWVSLSVPPSL